MSGPARPGGRTGPGPGPGTVTAGAARLGCRTVTVTTEAAAAAAADSGPRGPGRAGPGTVTVSDSDSAGPRRRARWPRRPGPRTARDVTFFKCPAPAGLELGPADGGGLRVSPGAGRLPTIMMT
jgi:hypothetical protein